MTESRDRKALAQPDPAQELAEALRNLLEAHSKEAAAIMAEQVASENYSDPTPEQLACEKAMLAASAAEKDARAALAKYEGSKE